MKRGIETTIDEGMSRALVFLEKQGTTCVWDKQKQLLVLDWPSQSSDLNSMVKLKCSCEKTLSNINTCMMT